MTQLRIAQFHSTLPEQGRKVGGVEVFVDRLADRLSERGHDVTVFSFGPRPAEARYAVSRAGPAWLAENRVARLTVAPLMLNRLTLAGFDVIHLHGDDWFMVRRDIPTVRTFHGSARFEARSATSLQRRFTQAAVYPLEILASRLATLSFAGGARLPWGYKTHGSLTYAVTQPPASATTRAERPTILFVGTWDGRKRGSFLAERFSSEVLSVHPAARLLMVSDRCVEAPGVEWIRFPSDAELSELYRSAWLFCMPSTYEGFGLPYLEAMSHGLPVVASPNPGAELVLGGGGGMIASDAELGRTLASLLHDADARARLAAAGRARTLDFSWERVLDDHETAYQMAMRVHRGGLG